LNGCGNLFSIGSGIINDLLNKQYQRA